MSNYNRVISSRHADDVEKSQVLEGAPVLAAPLDEQRGAPATNDATVGRAARSASDERRRDPASNPQTATVLAVRHGPTRFRDRRCAPSSTNDPVGRAARSASDERRRDPASDPQTATVLAVRHGPTRFRATQRPTPGRAMARGSRHIGHSRPTASQECRTSVSDRRCAPSSTNATVGRAGRSASDERRPRWSSSEERQRRTTPRPRKHRARRTHSPYAMDPPGLGDARAFGPRCSTNDGELRAFLNQRNAETPTRLVHTSRVGVCGAAGQMSAPSSSSSLSSSSESYLTYLMPSSTPPSKPSRPSSRTRTRSHMRRTEPAAWLT